MEEVGIDRDSHQPTVVVRIHFQIDVQERRGEQLAVFDDTDNALFQGKWVFQGDWWLKGRCVALPAVGVWGPFLTVLASSIVDQR